MKYTFASLSLVVIIAAIVGVFAGILVYFTLVAALMFLLLATVVAVTMMIIAHRKRRRSLEAAKARHRLDNAGTSMTNEQTTNGQ